MKRTYIECGVWHLGDRKRQKGNFLSILGTIVKPLQVSTASAIGGEIFKGIGKKYLREENGIEKEERKDIYMPRNNILLCRLPNPRRVQLPNGCVFFLQNKKESIDTLQQQLREELREGMFEKLDQGGRELEGLVREIKEKEDNRLALAWTQLYQQTQIKWLQVQTW